MSYRSMMLTNKEFFKQACRWKDSSSVQTAAEWWGAFQEVIIREIFYNGTCRVPGLGRFSIEERDGCYQKQVSDNGKTATYYVPPRIVPVFTPEDDFINDVNMQGVTKKYRKRLKYGGMTERDIEREVRAESMDAESMLEDMVEQRKKKAQKELQKLLAKKRKNNKESNERNKNKTLKERPVVQLDDNDNVIAEFNSMSEAMRITGIDKTHISYACSGRLGRVHAGGYKWKYAEEQKEDIEDYDELDESEACDTES